MRKRETPNGIVKVSGEKWSSVGNCQANWNCSPARGQPNFIWWLSQASLSGQTRKGRVALYLWQWQFCTLLASLYHLQRQFYKRAHCLVAVDKTGRKCFFTLTALAKAALVGVKSSYWHGRKELHSSCEDSSAEDEIIGWQLIWEGGEDKGLLSSSFLFFRWQDRLLIIIIETTFVHFV